MTTLLIWLDKCSGRVIIFCAVLLTVALGVINLLVGPELSFSVFYLLPVSLAAWYTGLRNGIVISVVCALTWRTAETLAGATFSHP